MSRIRLPNKKAIRSAQHQTQNNPLFHSVGSNKYELLGQLLLYRIEKKIIGFICFISVQSVIDIFIKPCIAVCFDTILCKIGIMYCPMI